MELLNRDIIAAIRATLAELKFAPHHWTTVVPIVNASLNAAPLPRLYKNRHGAYRIPHEIMTGITPVRAINHIISNHSPQTLHKDMTQSRVQQIIAIDIIQKSLDKLHKDVASRANNFREGAVKAHNLATNIIPCKFSSRFCFVRQATNSGHKCSFKWHRPQKIFDLLSDVVYAVQPLMPGEIQKVHASPLRKYNANCDGAEVPEEVLALADRTQSHSEVIEKKLDIGRAPDGIFLQVMWQGLPDEREFTWHN